MGTAYELYMNAGLLQETAARLSYQAVLEGSWKDAAQFLRSAVKDAPEPWASQAREMIRHYESLGG